MRGMLIASAVVAVAVAGGIVVDPGVASAHEPAFSLSCDGARLTGVGYDEEHTNEAAIFIDGTEVFHVDDFGTTLDQTVPIPQDGAIHSVRFVVDAQGPGTEDHPEFDLDVTRPVGPCGEATTSSTEPSTTSTTSSTSSTTSSTTTSSTTSTSSTLPSTLSITAFSPVCLRDAPYIDVTFGPQPEFNGLVATVRFVDLDGNVVGTHTATYQAGTTVRFLYPGAAVDANGNPVDWPGWVFDGDEWVRDPSDARLRDGLTVVVDVNPTATGSVGYPPETPACNANPSQSSSGGSLPATGGDVTPWVQLALALVGAGVALVAFRRHRMATR